MYIKFTCSNYKLKSCPFCGGEAKINSNRLDGFIHTWISCENCCATSQIIKFKDSNKITYSDVVELWNKRVIEAEVE